MKLAREIRNKRRVEVSEGKYLNRRTKLTFTELADMYWERKGSHLSYNGLVCMLNRWKEHFADKRVAQITRAGVEGYLTTLKGKAVSTQNKHLTMLRAMFNWAIDQELIQGNPTARIKKLKGETKRVRWLTVEEITKLLTACNDRLRPIVGFALNTGMRRGEIFDLVWTVVSFKTGLIWVHTSQKGKEKYIPMTKAARRILENLPKKSEYVFPSPKGGKYTTIKTAFNKALKKAEIEDFRFHDLRHIFASHLVMNGRSLDEVGELLGHSTTQMTKRYAHLSPEFKARSIAVLDAVYENKPDLKVIKRGKK